MMGNSEDKWFEGIEPNPDDMLDLIQKLENRVKLLEDTLRDAWEGEHYEYCISERCPSVAEHIRREFEKINNYADRALEDD